MLGAQRFGILGQPARCQPLAVGPSGQTGHMRRVRMRPQLLIPARGHHPGPIAAVLGEMAIASGNPLQIQAGFG